MIWAVLVGNTRTVSALMEGRKVIRRMVVPTDSLRNLRNARVWATRIWKTSEAEGLMVASVVPAVDPLLRRGLMDAFNLTPEFVKIGKKLGIAVRVKKPGQVGADRLANAVAAKELYGAPVIVVDYGTGTTFDVVNRQGAYCGGAILPGLGISLQALHEFTAKIPRVKFEPVKNSIGRTTEEAVRSGVYHGAVGTTRELLAGIRKELGTRAPAIATGGWSEVFRKTGLFKRVDPNLTLTGLAILREKNRA